MLESRDSQRPARTVELDGLRAVAILGVLCCHYPGFAKQFHGLPKYGSNGVDLFFALSGFLITSILLKMRGQPQPYRTFYGRRLVRILPPYLMGTCIVFIAALHQGWMSRGLLCRFAFFLQAFDAPLRFPWKAYFAHPVRMTALPFAGLHQHIVPPHVFGLYMAMTSAPAPYWSLSIEEWFYFLWAPVVLHCSRRTATAVAIATCVLELYLRWTENAQAAFFGLEFRFDGLMYGALIAIAFTSPLSKPTQRQIVRALCGAIALYAALCVASAHSESELTANLMRSLGVSAFDTIAALIVGLLVMRAGSTWSVGRVLRSRLLVSIGTISYTMYVLHVSLGVAAGRIALALHFESRTWATALLATGLTIAAAYASWHLVERPLLGWKDKRFPNAPHPRPPALE